VADVLAQDRWSWLLARRAQMNAGDAAGPNG